MESVDMRKGLEGLYGLVRNHLGQDPLSGHLFLFTNRSKTRLKAPVWDGSGLWVCTKRLEKRRFRWPAADNATSDPQLRIAILERELAWAHLKIQALTGELRQQRIQRLGPCSEH